MVNSHVVEVKQSYGDLMTLVIQRNEWDKEGYKKVMWGFLGGCYNKTYVALIYSVRLVSLVVTCKNKDRVESEYLKR